MMEEIQDVDGCVWRNMREAFWGDKVLCLCEMVDKEKKGGTGSSWNSLYGHIFISTFPRRNLNIIGLVFRLALRY